MTWVMSSRRVDRPRRYQFFIGAVKVAEVSFVKMSGQYRARLQMWDRNGTFDSMHLALKAMHEELNGPSPEDAKVGDEKWIRDDIDGQ